MAFIKIPATQNWFTSTKFLLWTTLFFGLALRLYANWSLALNNNEASVIGLVKKSWPDLWRAAHASHSIVYEACLKIWTNVFGLTIFSVRSFSIVLGVITAYLGYRILKQIFANDNLALKGALILSLSPFLIQNSVSVSAYALAGFLLLLSVYLFAQAITTQKIWDWVGFGLSALFTLAVFFPNFLQNSWQVLLSVIASLAVVWAIYQIPKFTTRRVVIILVAILSVWFTLKQTLATDVKNHPGIPGAEKFILENGNKNDKIYISTNMIFNVFQYYNQTEIVPQAYESSAPKNTNVWLVWTNTAQAGTKPNVPGNWNELTEKNFPDNINLPGDIVVTEYHVK